MKWFEIGLRIIPYIGTAVAAVERFVSGKGQVKQDAAIDMVKVLLESVEGAAAKDLIDNEKVQAGARGVVDAVVAFQNIVAAEGGNP